MSGRDLFNTIVISGAATKGLCYLGVLSNLIKNSVIQMDNIKTLVGVSSGSMIAFLLLIGYTPLEILQHLIEDKTFYRLSQTFDLQGAWSGKGMFRYDVIQQTLVQMTLVKLGYLPTMGQIRNAFGKRIIIGSYNETTEQSEYFDSDDETYHNMPVITAIRCSSNLPWFFEDYSYKEQKYTDGGIADNLPIHLVDNYPNNVLALVGTSIIPQVNNDFMKKVLKRLQTPVRSIMLHRIDGASHRVKFVHVDTEMNIYNFNVGTGQMLDLYEKGVNIGEQAPSEWVEKHTKKD